MCQEKSQISLQFIWKKFLHADNKDSDRLHGYVRQKECFLMLQLVETIISDKDINWMH